MFELQMERKRSFRDNSFRTGAESDPLERNGKSAFSPSCLSVARLSFPSVDASLQAQEEA
jgi:hypothetical protein